MMGLSATCWLGGAALFASAFVALAALACGLSWMLGAFQGRAPSAFRKSFEIAGWSIAAVIILVVLFVGVYSGAEQFCKDGFLGWRP
jgi:hypothetical protein